MCLGFKEPHLEEAHKIKYLKTFIHKCTYTLLTWVEGQTFLLLDGRWGKAGRAGPQRNCPVHQPCRQRAATPTSSVSDANWPGPCALNPKRLPRSQPRSHPGGPLCLITQCGQKKQTKGLQSGPGDAA